MPFFSIIVPIYNIENYVRNCLDSILQQSFKDFEVLLIDDGSEDCSGEICDEYAARHPQRFFVYHFENRGASAARNRGLERARGEFVVFVDGDDHLGKGYLKAFYEMILEHKNIDAAICGVCVNGRNIVFNGSQSHNGYLSKETFMDMLPERKGIRGFLVNKAFRRSVLQSNNIRLDENAHMCEDLLYCVEFAQYMRGAALVNLPNYEYIQRHNSAVHQRFNEKRITVLETYKKVIDILRTNCNADAFSQLQANFLMHNVHVLWMLRGKGNYPEVKNTAKRFIKENIGIIWSAKLEARGKCKAIAMYLLSPVL